MGTETAGNEDRPCAKVQLKFTCINPTRKKKKRTYSAKPTEGHEHSWVQPENPASFCHRALEIRSRDKLAAVRNGIRPWVNPSEQRSFFFRSEEER